MNTNAKELYRFLSDTNSICEVSPPYYIEILETDKPNDPNEIALNVIRLSGRDNPSQVDFTLGDQLKIGGRNFIEFRCKVGSVWSYIMCAVNKGSIKRCIAHFESRGHMEPELKIFGKKMSLTNH